MNGKLLKEFKLELYDLCKKYHEIYNKSKSINNKNNYLFIKNIYLKVYSFNKYEDFIKYITQFKSNNKDINNLINKYKSNPEHIKQSLYIITMEYYNNYNNNKNNINKNKYLFISKIYNDIRNLNNQELIIYLNNVLNNNSIQMDVISKIKSYCNINNISNIKNQRDKIYNNVLADRVNELSNSSFINDIQNNLLFRSKTLNDNFYSLNYVSLLNCYILDHHVVKCLYNKEKLGNYEIIYLKEINRQMMDNPYLFFSLPLSNLTNEYLFSLEKYMPNIRSIIRNAKISIDFNLNLEKKYKQNSTNQSEEEILFKFLSYYIDYNRINNGIFDYEYLLKKLLSKNNLTFYEVSFIDKYLGYKKCVNNGLKDTEILFGDCDFMKNNINQHVLGIQDKGIILLNKKHVVGTSFRNNFSNKPSTILNGTRQTYEGLSQLQTIYHELAHAKQFKDSYEQKNTYESYISIINLIIKEQDMDDTSRNYLFYEVEANANMEAYKDIENFINNYLPFSMSKRNISDYKIQSYNKMLFNQKINSSFKKEITAKYEKDMADKYFLKKPNKLNEYPMFKQFYDNNGIPLDLASMLSKTKFNNEGYHYNQLVARIYDNELFGKQKYLKMNNEEKTNVISNINSSIKIVNLRLQKAIRILEQKSYFEIFDKSGVSRETLVKYNVLVDMKIGNRLLNLYNNILMVDPNIKSIIDNNILNEMKINKEKNSVLNNMINSMLKIEERVDIKL